MADDFDVFDVFVNADTTHPRLAEAIARVGLAATIIHREIGGRTTLEALMTVYSNLAVQQIGVAETRAALTRAIALLPELERGLRTLGKPQGRA